MHASGLSAPAVTVAGDPVALRIDRTAAAPARNQTAIPSSPEHVPAAVVAVGSGGTFRYMGQWDMMGNIAGNAPDYIAGNKWKLGWIEDDEGACTSSDGVSEHTLSAVDDTSEKLVAVRTGTNTTLVAELRAPVGVDSVAGGNTARYCESGGILLYTVDSTLRNRRLPAPPSKRIRQSPAWHSAFGASHKSVNGALQPDRERDQGLPAAGCCTASCRRCAIASSPPTAEVRRRS